jgi:hypothetical protein
MAKKSQKGQKMEETLRIYFLKSGYYVVRGIPFKYKDFDVTDIDLWMYNRTSSVSREISIVDIKNKKTPQAIERIFWVKGLQLAVNATNALVATTDRRPDVKDFGKDMNVFVLDGSFLKKIEKYEKYLDVRITEEDIFTLIDNYSLGKLDGDWKGKLTESKSLLAVGLNFDNVNKLIENAHFFIEQVITKPSQREIALRCFYKICSFIAINIDYLQRDLSFLEDIEARKKAFIEGFRYGSKGERKIKQIIDMSLSFVEQYSDNGKITANQARYNIKKQLEDLQTNILADYFSNYEVLQKIFKTAITFEEFAMKKEFVNHLEGSIEIKSFVSVLLDFFSVDRVRFSDAIKT